MRPPPNLDGSPLSNDQGVVIRLLGQRPDGIGKLERRLEIIEDKLFLEALDAAVDSPETPTIQLF